MSYKMSEERTDETDSVEITRGMQGKYSYSIKMYCEGCDMEATIEEVDVNRKRIEKRLNGEKSPEAPKEKQVGTDEHN